MSFKSVLFPLPLFPIMAYFFPFSKAADTFSKTLLSAYRKLMSCRDIRFSSECTVLFSAISGQERLRKVSNTGFADFSSLIFADSSKAGEMTCPVSWVTATMLPMVIYPLTAKKPARPITKNCTATDDSVVRPYNFPIKDEKISLLLSKCLALEEN